MSIPGSDPGLAPGTPGVSPRRRLVPAAVTASLLLAALLLAWGAGSSRTEAPLDPANPAPGGSQALARVLEARDVEVTVARGERALRDAGVAADTTVLVASTTELRESTVSSLAALTGDAERLVLVRPERRVLRSLASGVSTRDAYRRDLVSSCDTPDARPGETLSRSQAEYRSDEASVGCFVTDGYAALLAVPARPGRAPLLLLGSLDPMTNETLAAADNAAVALRALGRSSRLVWYVPDLRDAAASEPDEQPGLAPPWFGPLVLLGGFALLAVLAWRGRRLGRLAVEPLPVTVRATEVTESRGRLYRRARDTARAAAVLRDGTRRRLTAYLRLPPAGPAATVAAVASASGRTLADVAELLYGPAPAAEADLLALGRALRELEKEARGR